MDWIRSHPYASTLAAACILVIGGVVLVANRSNTPESSGVSSWNGNTGVLGATNSAPQQSSTQIPPPLATAQNYGTQTLPYKQNVPVSNSQGTLQNGTGADSFDFNTLMAEISQSTQKPKPSQSSTTIGQNTVDAWAYIPTGLISVQKPTSGRTTLQQALYTYGNETGSYIEGYDAAHGDQAQILDNADKDRQNSVKQAAVARIGQDLETIGQGLAETTDVPAEAAADNTALSNSYIDIGKKLIAVAQAEPLRDSDLVAAIEAYDTAMNTFNRNYIALANLFSSYGVTFSQSDPGSVFSFSSSAL